VLGSVSRSYRLDLSDASDWSRIVLRMGHMQTIEIDDEVFGNLELVRKLTGLPHSQIVRQWMQQRVASPDSRAAAGSQASTPPPKQQAPVNARDKALCDYAQSPGFLANRSVVDQFLSILSFLHKQNPDKFVALQSLEGRKRKYIASSEQELENSGTSVNPKKIPYTNFWVVTNNDTNNKKLLLRQALTLLGYSPETIRTVPESLR
jgi:negative modulator of initiation of replication